MVVQGVVNATTATRSTAIVPSSASEPVSAATGPQLPTTPSDARLQSPATVVPARTAPSTANDPAADARVVVRD